MTNLELKIKDAAHTYASNFVMRKRSEIRESFCDGAMSPEAKEFWQQGMYSKEDLKVMIPEFMNYWQLIVALPGTFNQAVNEWVNQYKKKS